MSRYANLGWTKLDEVHVVNIGKVQDSSSRKALAPEDYAHLREANVLDEILWHWTRRAFLERLHCPPHVPTIADAAGPGR